MKSHAILRTNVGLTTNAKVMVSSNYSLFIDSIISTSALSSTKYKRREFNKSNYLDEIIPIFFKDTPADVAFFIKDDFDNKNMSKDFAKQYDDIYQYSARNITENKDYREEFEYFAPLHISKGNLPSNFVIFRIDGPGLNIMNKDNFNDEIVNKLKCVKIFDMTRSTPLGEWLDLNITSNRNFPSTGLYIDFRKLEFSTWNGIDYETGGYSEKSFMLDDVLSKEQTYLDFEKFILEGYKNNKVVYPSIINFSFLFDDTPATQTSLRTWSLNRYLGFYLDSLEFVKYVSPYILLSLKSDVVIDSNNIIYSLSEGNPFLESFRNEENFYIEIGGVFYKIERFLEQLPSVVDKVQISNVFFEDLPNQSFITRYKIISDVNLEGRQSEINKNLVYLDSSTGNKLLYSDKSTFEIEGFDDADVWLIEINNKFHNIVKRDGDFYINTDSGFYQTLDKFEYYINDPDPKFRVSISLKVGENIAPKQFGIYRCKFTDIKDFDTDIVDTEYSKFEYMYVGKPTITDETKMYAVNVDSRSLPKDLDDFKINGTVVNIPASSEYIANSEIFRIEDNDLSILWKKNSQRIKWGFKNSISSNDYAYLLNNSFSSEDYNRTVNPYNPAPGRLDRNLDYFYTVNADSSEYSHQSLHIVDDGFVNFGGADNINNLLRLTGILDISYFSLYDKIEITLDNNTIPAYNTTTIIESIDFLVNSGWRITTSLNFMGGTVSGKIKNQTRTPFSLNKYLNIGHESDYFTEFFSKKTNFDSGNLVKNTKKWSLFNTGDGSIPNITLFRGLKFKVQNVSGLKVKEDFIEAINTSSNNEFENYKFSILLSKNNYTVSSDVQSINIATVSYSNNTMKWIIIDEWKHDKIYSGGDIVKWNESIYISLTQSQIVDPNIFPANSNQWGIYTNKNIFWNPVVDGSSPTISKNNMLGLGQFLFDSSTILPPLVFNHGEYYYSSGGSGINFWNPNLTYSIGNSVLYQDKIWTSTTSSNTFRPKSNSTYIESDGTYQDYWILDSNSNSIWTSVELWSPLIDYNQTNSNWNNSFTPGHYVIFEDVVYATITSPTIGVNPKLDISWKRVYSFVQDTNFFYFNNFNNGNNPIIKMNNRYYLCIDNGERNIPNTYSTLENGINIYINKKWKNILINIYVNDNTYTISEDLGLSTIIFKRDNLSNTKRDDIYLDLYSKLTANNFMNALNDLDNPYEFSDKVRYIVIEEDLSLKIWNFNDLNSVSSLPYIISCEGPDEFLVKLDSFKVEPSTISLSEIKPRRRLLNGDINSMEQINYYSDLSLSTIIKDNKSDSVKVINYSSLKNNLYNNLFRHSGYYSPIFHDIEIFESSNNYKFDTTLTNFGKIKERVISKINRQNNILKLRNNSNLVSIYPMLDEFGYHTISFYIFKSTWDLEYHIECQEIPQTEVVTGNQSIQFIPQNNSTINSNLNLL
jgi:hypothetical protein